MVLKECTVILSSRVSSVQLSQTYCFDSNMLYVKEEMNKGPKTDSMSLLWLYSYFSLYRSSVPLIVIGSLLEKICA